MAAYQYHALDKNGKAKKGVLSAESARLAKSQLLAGGYTPVSLDQVKSDQAKGAAKRLRFSKADLVLVTRQLATLVNATTPVEEALGAVAAQMNKGDIRSTLLSIRGRIIEGWRLSDALAEFPQIFSPLYRGIVSSGEVSGQLGTVLNRLADMLEKNRATLMNALTALIYPVVLGIIALVVITGLMTFIVPKIVEQFETMGASLPMMTKIVMGTSNFLAAWGGVLLIIMALIAVLLWRALKIAGFKLWVDRRLLKLPLLGKLSMGLDAARYSRTLATLVAADVPLLDCLRTSRTTVVNAHIAQQLDKMIQNVSEGGALASALRQVTSFPPMLGYMVAAGERAGEIPAMLDKVADQMEGEFETATKLALRLIEPLLIVGMGVVIMLIMLAVLIPVLQINTLSVG